MIPKEMIEEARFELVRWGWNVDEDAMSAALTAALSSQWRDMESAPRDGTQILAAVPWLPYAKALFWATYANEWRCPATEDRHKYEPVLWHPLPKPPFVLELPPPPTPEEKTGE